MARRLGAPSPRLRGGLALAAVLTPLAVGAPALATAPAPSRAELIATAQRARLADVDHWREECGDERTVAAWLRELVAPRARSIRWSAGRCRLVVPHSPRDAGGAGAYCAQATILARGARRPVTLEIYMQRSDGGLRGYAFRAAGDLADGWEDYMRFTGEFEATWRRLQHLPALPEDAACR